MMHFRPDREEEMSKTSSCDDSLDAPVQLLGSDIMSLSVGQSNGKSSNFRSKLARDISVTFRPKDVDVSRVSCSFWTHRSREWSREGCAITSRNASHITCQCEQLSAYALLVSKTRERRVDVRSLGPIWELAFTVGSAFVFALFGTCFAIAILAVLRRKLVNRAEPFNLATRKDGFQLGSCCRVPIAPRAFLVATKSAGTKTMINARKKPMMLRRFHSIRHSACQR